MLPADPVVGIATSVCLVLVGFITTYLLTGTWEKISRARKLISKDLHKPRESWGVKIGGLPAAFIMITVLATTSLVLSIDAYPLLTAAVFFASMGLVDDFIGLKNVEKIALSGIPFLVFHDSLRPFPPFHQNPLLQIAAVTLFGIYVTNAFNTLAGFNGLEVGSSSIIYLTLAVLLLLWGDIHGIVLLILTSTVLAFLPYNWYPARAFPGNILTFLLGGLIGFISAQRGIYWPLIVMTLPHGVDFLLKLVSWGRTEKKIPTKVKPDGTLIPPPNKSLAWFLIKKGINKEYELVKTILMIEVVLATLTLLVHLPR